MQFVNRKFKKKKKKKKVFYRVFSSFPKLEKHEMLYIGGKSKTKNVKKKNICPTELR